MTIQVLRHSSGSLPANPGSFSLFQRQRLWPELLLNRLSRLDVLLIDEFGYLNLKPEQANTFFKLMEERYHRHSTVITTNLGYDEWHNFLGNKAMVDALLSRVRHYCHTVAINGPSLRELQG